jgi:hypothetical protein
MHYYVYSKDQERKSRGKTSSGHHVDYKLVVDLHNHHTMSIEGETCEYLGDGSRGGPRKVIRRSLYVTLELTDLERIFEAALTTGLFTPVRFATAAESMRAALSQLEPNIKKNKSPKRTVE